MKDKVLPPPFVRMESQKSLFDVLTLRINMDKMKKVVDVKEVAFGHLFWSKLCYSKFYEIQCLPKISVFKILHT